MFETGGGGSAFELGLTAVLDRPERVVVDAVHPGLRSGRTWLAPAGGAHARGGGTVTPEFSELRRLLEAGAAPLDRAAEASRAIARWSAVMATSLTEFARYRPAGRFDRQPGERGAMSAATRAARPEALAEVSEWAVDEVAPALRISAPAATVWLSESIVLTERPRTLDLLARGRLSPEHARQMVTVVGPVSDDAVRADIEAHVLRLLGDKTPPQLGDCARRIVLRKDAEAAGRKLVAAVRGRGVCLRDRRDGTGTLVVDLPLPTAAAIYRQLRSMPTRRASRVTSAPSSSAWRTVWPTSC
ncbi:hypothetical protein ACI789_11125 [Geodermatophilus sp. SYSU D00965]